MNSRKKILKDTFEGFFETELYYKHDLRLLKSILFVLLDIRDFIIFISRLITGVIIFGSILVLIFLIN